MGIVQALYRIGRDLRRVQATDQIACDAGAMMVTTPGDGASTSVPAAFAARLRGDAAGNYSAGQIALFLANLGFFNADTRLVGELVPYSGTVLPVRFLWPNGQNVSRSTYAALLAATTVALTGTTTSGSTSLTAVAGTADALAKIAVGMPIEGASIPLGATVAAYAGSTITLSAAATATASGVAARVFPHGNGDGSSTFGVVDVRGRVVAARDNLGGTAAGRLTSANAGFNPTRLGAGGGDERMQAHTHQWGTNTQNSVGGTGSPGFGTTDAITSSAGAGASQNIQPTLVLDMILYAGV